MQTTYGSATFIFFSWLNWKRYEKCNMIMIVMEIEMHSALMILIRFVSFYSFFRIMTFSYLAAFNWWLLLCPATLSHDWQMGSVPLVTSLSDSRNVITCLFLGLAILLAVRSITDFEVGFYATSHYNAITYKALKMWIWRPTWTFLDSPLLNNKIFHRAHNDCWQILQRTMQTGFLQLTSDMLEILFCGQWMKQIRSTGTHKFI